VCESEEETESVASVEGLVIEPATNLVLQESIDVKESFGGLTESKAEDEKFQVKSVWLALIAQW